MNKAAYEALCQERMQGLYRIALSILRNPADAQDAVQQAFLNAWVHREKAYPGRETGWITRILINECRNIQRHRMRVFPVETVPDRPTFQENEIGLKEAMDSLPEKLRLALLLKYMEGMTEKEAALALNISLTTLKSRLFRGRKALAKQLKEEVKLE